MNPNIAARINQFRGRVGIAASVVGIVLLLAVASSVAAQATVAAYTGCGGADAPILNDAFEARVVELVNQQRAANGNLPPLRRIAALGKAARYHAADLGTDNYFSHDTYDRNGDSLVRICNAFERMRHWYDWSGAGENIAAGYRTAEDVMAGWMNSPGHRDNILNPTYREIGVGYFSGAGDYGVYWVQNLGVRHGEYPIIINNDAATTSDRTVEMFVHGTWSEMRLRNDSDAWDEWQPFTSRFTWLLNDVAGERIVSAELRSGAQTYSACDTITLVNRAAAEPAQPITDYQLFLPSIVSNEEQQPLVTCE